MCSQTVLPTASSLNAWTFYWNSQSWHSLLSSLCRSRFPLQHTYARFLSIWIFFFFLKRGLVSDIIANDSPVIALPHLFSLPLFLALYFLENISLCQDQSTSKHFWTINSVHISHIRYWQICELTDHEPFGGDEFCQQTFPTEQQAVHRRRAPARQSQPALLLCCCRRRAVNVTLSRNTSIPKNQATIF